MTTLFNPISDFYDDEVERRHQQPAQPFTFTAEEIAAANEIMEASFLESQVSVDLRDSRRCPTCSGFGDCNYHGTGLMPCPKCKGKGRL